MNDTPVIKTQRFSRACDKMATEVMCILMTACRKANEQNPAIVSPYEVGNCCRAGVYSYVKTTFAGKKDEYV
jgi:hypothetical protein